MAAIYNKQGWDSLRSVSGPNKMFPGKDVYAFCSLESLDPNGGKEWLARFRKEATEAGIETDIKSGILYILF